ncbi:MULTISPECIES: terpene synthase family protein [unclassified Kitasatospora]|uniref:terpene synthase family protein n=1 Tax=unclassified Kitasatospora TaxID=2633591 RepID=UPI0024731E46|nr:terpene synthase family protein [Kitasatospora sp. MAP12-44]
MVKHGLHSEPDIYLAHGYVGLCLRAWPGASGAPLQLAVQWALLTWRLDDVLDVELREAAPLDVGGFVGRLVDTVEESEPVTPDDHPTVRALADLVERTRQAMPGYWWGRYRKHLVAWVEAAHEKLVGFVQPGRVPTLRQYLTIRPPDGGMVLAAMWTELAQQVVTPDWNSPLVQSLLAAFSACGYLANDLAAGAGDTFTALDALARTEGLPPDTARHEVLAQLHAEERRFWWLRSALREYSDAARPSTAHDGLTEDTARFALHLDSFRHALREWTSASTRYAPAAPEGPDAAAHRLRRTVIGRHSWLPVDSRPEPAPLHQDEGDSG